MRQLRACDDFVSAQELHRRLEDEGVRVGLATVYRQLNALAERSGAVGRRFLGCTAWPACAFTRDAGE